MTKPKKSGLGKGLDALFVDNETADSGIVTLRLTEIEPNRDQPRKIFSEEALRELADSIKEHGIISPLLVRPLTKGTYQIVAGERRWRASRMAGLTEVPVVIRELDEVEAMEIALIENLQRENLNAIEEAAGYKQLIEKYSMTQEQISKHVGKSRPAVANSLRLLNLPNEVIQLVKEGEISPGHARALLSSNNPNQVLEVAHKIKNGRYSVRDVEKMVKHDSQHEDDETVPQNQIWGNTFFKEMQCALETELGRKVKIIKGQNGGTIQIQFFDEEDIRDIASRLTGERVDY